VIEAIPFINVLYVMPEKFPVSNSGVSLVPNSQTKNGKYCFASILKSSEYLVFGSFLPFRKLQGTSAVRKD